MSSTPGPGSAVEPRPWQTGLAPVYIGVFLWVAFFDQLGRRALPVGGLGPSMLGAAAAGPLAYLLLFRVPATWGRQVGRGLTVVSTGTFGARGATAVPGLLIAVGQLALFAVALGYAIDLTFQGLVALRLVDARSLRPVAVGGGAIRPPLVLITALAWAVATALVGFRLVRWIAYLMQFFPIFPAVLLGGSMLAMLTGLRDFAPTGVDPATGHSVAPSDGARMAFGLTFQWAFAFSALAGLAGADWGAGSVSRRDVRVGGWLGMGLAPAILSTLALIAVAGHQGRAQEASRAAERSPFPSASIGGTPGPSGASDSPPYTFRAVLAGGFDRRVSGAMLMVFGLASLAPACFASFVFGERLAAIGPGISRFTWTMIGASTAWLLVVGGWSDRPEVVFNALGAAFAPVAGAMAADYRRQRGVWPGPRRGVNPAGLIAWALGFAAGVAPMVLRTPVVDYLPPSAPTAFLVAYLAYELLGLCGLETAPAEARPPA